MANFIDTHRFVTGLRIASKQDLIDSRNRLESRMELLEERMTRKMAQQQIATILAIAAIMAVFRFWEGF